MSDRFTDRFIVPTYPLVRYHPVFGRVVFEDQETAVKTMVPVHDWFATPEEADQHRTQREADMVHHVSQREMVKELREMPQHKETLEKRDDAAEKQADEQHLPEGAVPVDELETVIHSVTHTERVARPFQENYKTPEEMLEISEQEQKAREEQLTADRTSPQHVEGTIGNVIDEKHPGA